MSTQISCGRPSACPIPPLLALFLALPKVTGADYHLLRRNSILDSIAVAEWELARADTPELQEQLRKELSL